ncbi:MAG: hypothetical protein QF371_05875, partial [Flavobacteriales bacterium]|nr:hypothetical protein [Flavobacteriales bacterium]
MAEGKRIRKVLKDIGVGLSTAKEFLESNGYSDINPNSRLDDKAYDLLLGEFAADQKMKEEAEAKAEVLQKRNDERLAAAEEKEEPVVIKAKVEKTEGPKVMGSVAIEDIDPEVKKKKVEEDKVKKEAEEAEEAKKAEEVKTKEKAEQAEEEKKTEEEKKAEEVIRAKVDKLAGAKVLGKMDLPVEKPKEKKPVATSTDSADKKRKRKRVRRPVKGESGGAKGGQKGAKREKRAELSDEEIQKQFHRNLVPLTYLQLCLSRVNVRQNQVLLTIAFRYMCITIHVRM